MDENIFETAGKLAKSKKDKEQSQTSSDKNKDLSNLKIEDMMQKMQDMNNDLKGQITEIYRKGASANIDVDHLIKDSNAFAVKNLDKMREQEQVLNDQINGAILPESCLRPNPKNKEKLTQERKGKLRGSRNNWIPVR